MIVDLPDDTLQSLLQLLGVVNGSGEVQAAWFGNPLKAMHEGFQGAGGVSALIAALDAFIPRAPGSDLYPLLAELENGGLYLSVEQKAGAGAATVGISGDWRSSATAQPAFRASATVNLLELRDSGSPFVSAVQTPSLELALAIDLDWTAGSDPVGLESVELSLTLADAGGTLDVTPALTLTGLQLSAAAPRTETLEVGTQAAAGVLAELASALAVAALGESGAGSTPQQSALLTLLGLDGDAGSADPIPLQSPGKLRAWLGRQLTADMQSWTNALGELLGAETTSLADNGAQLTWTPGPQVGLALTQAGTSSAPTL